MLSTTPASEYILQEPFLFMKITHNALQRTTALQLLFVHFIWNTSYLRTSLFLKGVCDGWRTEKRHLDGVMQRVLIEALPLNIPKISGSDLISCHLENHNNCKLLVLRLIPEDLFHIFNPFPSICLALFPCCALVKKHALNCIECAHVVCLKS